MLLAWSQCLDHKMILMESRKVLVIGVIAICDWFASVCFLSRVVCVSDIMTHDAHCIMCFTIGFIAFEDLLRFKIKSMEYIMYIYPSILLDDLYQMDMIKK